MPWIFSFHFRIGDSDAYDAQIHPSRREAKPSLQRRFARESDGFDYEQAETGGCLLLAIGWQAERDDIFRSCRAFTNCRRGRTVLLESERRSRACTGYERGRPAQRACEGEPKVNNRAVQAASVARHVCRLSASPPHCCHFAALPRIAASG